MGLLGTWNVASEAQELNFLILFNFNYFKYKKLMLDSVIGKLNFV